jgi:hypothetical protein
MVGARERRSGTGLGVCDLYGALNEGISVGVAILLKALFILSLVIGSQLGPDLGENDLAQNEKGFRWSSERP